MNYGGKGLGKYENGIVEPIIINESLTLGGEEEPKKKLMYIASGSMLNQMDEKRLSTNSMDVKVRSHGGCKIRCMYTHLPEIFKDKPEYILFHIGTNDCSEKTSDEVLRELKRLTDYVKKVYPTTIIIISLPTVRTDNTRSRTIQRNLTTKLKRSYYPILDNSNILETDLGKKGLHFNNFGNRKMLGNIISLIKRL